MKIYMLVVGALIVSSPIEFVSSVSAASNHNGGCVGFAGSMSGYKFAGLKCYLDSAPGDYVIRTTVKERDDKKLYNKLMRLSKRPLRCTLTRGSEMPSGNAIVTAYKISNC